MSNVLKITDELAAACADRQRAGLSLREIAAWLSAKHGVAVTHMAVRGALERHATKTAAASPPPTAVPPPSRGATKTTPPPSPAAASQDGEREPDLALYDKMIVEGEEDIAKARREGATQNLATFTRTQAFMIEQRRKIRPPPPVAVDDELLDAGRRAAEKLGAWLERELGKGAA